jgi:hypothetical protein
MFTAAGILKATRIAENEMTVGVMFKMKREPRITSVLLLGFSGQIFNR